MTEFFPFGRWLKERRRALDLTQKELAQRIGCSTVTIHKIETGALHPSKEIAERLAICLEIPQEVRGTFLRLARGGLLDPSSALGIPPSTGTRLRTHNLPFPATQLIGREAELTAIRKRLHDGARLLTLAGPPGIGKTRLALEVAYQVFEEYSDGVFFVYLAPVSDTGLVADAIGRVLNIPEARARPMEEQITNHLREKQSLLILDNFEQVVAAAPLVTKLLAACPWLTIMVTSRQTLRIRSERQYAVHPLIVPELGVVAAADVLRYSAVALFVERAQAVAPAFALTNAGAASVAEICRRLDGVPLAIELVATHMRLISPSELLEHWTGAWILSSGWLFDGPPRHQTLYDAIDWSCRLLDERERSLLHRLAVFAGGADLRAIEVVCNCRSLDCLASLIDKSLVNRVVASDGEGRFVLLEIIREYAAERLAAGDEEAEARLGHARYYRQLAAEGRQGINGPQQLAWFRLLETEQPNFRAALAWTLSRDPEGQRLVVELGLQIAVDLFWFWSVRGHLREGLDWIERGLAATECWGDTIERANAFWEAGACAGYLGLGRKRQNYLDGCVHACHTLAATSEGAETPPGAGVPTWGLLNEARRQLAYAYSLIGFFTTKHDDYPAAKAYLEKSVTICRADGDEFDLAYALNCLGHWAGRFGGIDMARPALEESLALFRRSGNLWAGALALGNLIRVYEYLGEFERCRSLLQESGLPAAIIQDLGELLRIQAVMWWLGYLASSAGDEAYRFEVFSKAVGLQDATGYRSFVDSSLYETVYLALQAGMPVRAVRLAAATQVWLERLHMHLDFPPELDMALSTARQQLGEGTFTLAWAEGRSMTVSESAAYALSGEE